MEINILIKKVEKKICDKIKCEKIIAIAGPINPKFGNPNQPNVKAPDKTICKKQPEI